MRPVDLQRQVRLPAPAMHEGVPQSPLVYPDAAWNEVVGEPFILKPDAIALPVAAGAEAITSFRATEEFWYEIEYFVFRLAASTEGGANENQATQFYPASVLIRIPANDLSPCPSYAPLSGFASDGRDTNAKLPVAYVLRPNMDMDVYIRNDGPRAFNAYVSARTRRKRNTRG